MVGLPQFGFQAVILGTTAFTRDSRSIEQSIASVGRAAFLLDRNTAGITRGLDAANERLAVLSDRADLANRRLVALTTGTFATFADQERARLKATVDSIQSFSNGQIASAKARQDAEVAAAAATRNAIASSAKQTTTDIIQEHQVQVADAITASNRIKQADLARVKQDTEVIAAANATRDATIKGAQQVTADVIQEHRVQVADAITSSTRILQADRERIRQTRDEAVFDARERARIAAQVARATPTANIDLAQVRAQRDAEIRAAQALAREQVNDAQRANEERVRLARSSSAQQIAVAKETEAATVAAASESRNVEITAARAFAQEQIDEAQRTNQARIALAQGFSEAQIGAARETEAATIASARTTEAAAVQATEQRAAAQITSIKAVEATEIASARARTEAVIANEAAQQAAVEAAAEKEAAARKLALGVAAAAGAAVVTGFGLAAIDAAKFEKELINTKAIGELTDAGMQELSKTVLEVGANSKLGFSDLNEAGVELIKTGVDINQVLGANGALKTVNDLIVASGGELKAADAATAVVVGLNAFAKTGATIPQVANAMTAAVQKSAITFTGYSAATRQGANASALMGLSVQEFSAAVLLMGKTIKDGTLIGTGLTQFFLKLLKPSADASEIMAKYKINLFDATGAVRPFRDTLIDLNREFSDQAVAQGRITEKDRDQALATLASSRAIKVLIPLVNSTTQAYDEAVAQTSDLTAVQQVADTQMSSTAAQWQRFTNNLNAAVILIGQQLLPELNSLIENLIASAQAFPTTEVGKFGAALFGIVGTLLNVVGAIKDFVTQNEIARVGALALAVVLGAEAVAAIIRFAEALVLRGIGALVAFTAQMATTAAVTLASTGNMTKAFLASGAAAGVLGLAVAGMAVLVVPHIREAEDALANLMNRLGDFGISAADVLEKTTLIGKAQADQLRGASQVMKGIALNIHNDAQAAITDAQKAQDAIGALTRDAGRTPAGGPETTDPGEDPSKKVAEAAKKVETLFRDLGTSLDDIARTSLQKTQDIARQTADKIAEAVHDANREIEDANRKAVEDAAKFDVEASAKRNADDRKAALDREISDQEFARKQQVEIDDAAFKEQRAEQDQFFKDEQTTAERGFKEQIDAQTLARKQQAEIDDAAFKAQLAAQTQALRDQQDLELQALKDQQAAAEQVLKQQSDDQLAALKLSDDQVVKERENKLALLKIEEDYRQKLADLLEKVNADREKAAHDEEVRHTIAIRNARTQAARDAEDRLHAARIGAANQIGVTDVNKLQTEFSRAVADEKAKQAEQAKTDQLKQSQDKAESDLRKQLAAQERAFKAKNDADERALKQKHDAEDRTLKAAQDAAELTRRFQIEAADSAFQQQQAQATQQFKDGLDAQARARKADLDAQDLARKQEQEQTAQAAKEEADAAKRKLDQQIEDEDNARKRAAIFQERDDRIAAINEALTEKKRQIDAQAADELRTVQRNLDDQTRALQEKLQKELPDILDGTNGALASRVNALTSFLFKSLEIVRSEAFTTAQQLAQALGLNQAFQTQLATQAIPGYNGQTLPTFAEGGIVPGPIGSPVLAVVHGGERFAGVRGQHDNLLRPATGAAATIVNNAILNSTVNYNVDAHYGRVQSEGSLLMDLRALRALRR